MWIDFKTVYSIACIFASQQWLSLPCSQHKKQSNTISKVMIFNLYAETYCWVIKPIYGVDEEREEWKKEAGKKEGRNKTQKSEVLF